MKVSYVSVPLSATERRAFEKEASREGRSLGQQIRRFAVTQLRVPAAPEEPPSPTSTETPSNEA